MLKAGNTAPQVCTLNLLRTVRGEVPYVRTKGIGRENIDMPETDYTDLCADAEWVVETFEPRVDIDDFDVGELLGGEHGDIGYTVNIELSGE